MQMLVFSSKHRFCLRTKMFFFVVGIHIDVSMSYMVHTLCMCIGMQEFVHCVHAWAPAAEKRELFWGYAKRISSADIQTHACACSSSCVNAGL